MKESVEYDGLFFCKGRIIYTEKKIEEIQHNLKVVISLDGRMLQVTFMFYSVLICASNFLE